MARFYKAVRLDGTDFHTGTVDYLSGTVVEHGRPDLRSPDPRRFLSLGKEATRCTGMQWPCRLLAVEPVGSVVDDALRIRARAVRVVEELPGHWTLGEHGEHLAELWQVMADMSGDRLGKLGRAHDTVGATQVKLPDTDLRVAQYALESAVRREVYRRGLPREAVGVMRDTLHGLLLRTCLTDYEYASLTGTWRTGIGLVHPWDT